MLPADWLKYFYAENICISMKARHYPSHPTSPRYEPKGCAKVSARKMRRKNDELQEQKSTHRLQEVVIMSALREDLGVIMSTS